jgi:hypothetical protein
MYVCMYVCVCMYAYVNECMYMSTCIRLSVTDLVYRVHALLFRNLSRGRMLVVRTRRPAQIDCCTTRAGCAQFFEQRAFFERRFVTVQDRKKAVRWLHIRRVLGMEHHLYSFRVLLCWRDTRASCLTTCISGCHSLTHVHTELWSTEILQNNVSLRHANCTASYCFLNGFLHAHTLTAFQECTRTSITVSRHMLKIFHLT